MFGEQQLSPSQTQHICKEQLRFSETVQQEQIGGGRPQGQEYLFVDNIGGNGS